MRSHTVPFLIAFIVLYVIPVNPVRLPGFIPPQPRNPIQAQSIQASFPNFEAQTVETETPTQVITTQPQETIEPTRTPKPTATPIPTPPPSDPGGIRLIISFGILAVIVVIFGVWINRQRTV